MTTSLPSSLARYLLLGRAFQPSCRVIATRLDSVAPLRMGRATSTGSFRVHGAAFRAHTSHTTGKYGYGSESSPTSVARFVSPPHAAWYMGANGRSRYVITMPAVARAADVAGCDSLTAS